jgi:hypothetical protein
MIGAARFTTATPASAPVSPTGDPPASRTAATRRVLIEPASTATTASSVGASVTRNPSTWRFGMPASASAASISLPPPCTTVSDARAASARMPRAMRCTSAGCSSSSPPSFSTTHG